jgi:UV DNA damage repair endonuclease
VFSNAERKRIVEMIRQGYGDRFFNVATIDSGTSEFAETLAQLSAEVRRQMTLKMDKKGYSAIKMQP